MLNLITTKTYGKSIKRLLRSGNFDDQELSIVIKKLLSKEKISEKYRDHQLNGPLSDYRDCHIENDLILIYKINKSEQTLTLYNIGSHSDLFS